MGSQFVVKVAAGMQAAHYQWLVNSLNCLRHSFQGKEKHTFIAGFFFNGDKNKAATLWEPATIYIRRPHTSQIKVSDCHYAS